jgi:hypothetical protein
MIQEIAIPDPMAEQTEHPNPMWDIVKTIPHDTLEDWRGQRRFAPVAHGRVFAWGERPTGGGARELLRTIELPALLTRSRIVREYSWAIANPRALDWMTRKLRGRGLLEAGAGRGYWAWQFAMRGVDVVASDLDLVGGGDNYYFSRFTEPGKRPVFHSIVQGNGPDMAAKYPGRALFLCWPPYDSEMATETLEAYRGNTLFYAGEGEGGCNAPDSFFRLLERDWEHVGNGPMVSWGGIRDYLDMYRRKARRRK